MNRSDSVISSKVRFVFQFLMAVNSANDYKEASSTQLFVQNRAERKDKANKDMTKYFAVSLLMFLAFAVSVVLVVLQIVPKSEKKQE